MSTEPKSETTDLLADLRELASYAGRLQDVIATAQRTVPAGAQGHDATGTVSAEVDALGSPLSLRVETGWEYRLDARDLGAAATEAYQQAVQRHLQEWSEDLNRQGWQYDIRDFDESTAQHPAPPIQAPTPSDTGEARSVDALVSDLIAELDFAHDLAHQPPPSPPETEAGSKVSVTLTQGQLTDVHIDAEWATGKAAALLNAELDAGLRSARLHEPESPTTLPHADKLDGLMAEVMTFMNQHRKAD